MFRTRNVPFARVLSPALVLVGLSSCVAPVTESVTTAAAYTSSDCFFVDQVRSVERLNSSAVNVDTGAGGVYQLRTLGSCPDLAWTSNLDVQVKGAAESICGPLDATLVVGGSSDAKSCRVGYMTRVSPN